MTDVFLSYASADRTKAAQIERVLTEAGYSVFWDQEVPPGRDWDSWIREQLAAARVSVVLWSKTLVASPNVRHEAMLARDAGKLIPAFIDPLEPCDFPMGLYLLQAADLSKWSGTASEAALRNFVAEVAARLDGRQPATPAVAPNPSFSRAHASPGSSAARLWLLRSRLWRLRSAHDAAANRRASTQRLLIKRLRSAL